MKRYDYRRVLTIVAHGHDYMFSGQGTGYDLDFVYGGVEDAEKLLQAYLEPFANILGSDLNAGWYNTARPHQLGGLDVTATVSWAKAPSSLFTYDLASDWCLTEGWILTTDPSLQPLQGNMEDRPYCCLIPRW